MIIEIIVFFIQIIVLYFLFNVNIILNLNFLILLFNFSWVQIHKIAVLNMKCN